MTSFLQQIGRFLSRMVMPNIAAFIAWGIITTLFHPEGWFPNEEISQMIEPMIFYALPLLIAYTGGKALDGVRGGVVAVVATTGLIAGSSIPMFMGAMFVGPFSGWLMKKVDAYLRYRMPTGFEMLIANFSAGILSSILAVLAYKMVGPSVQALTQGLTHAVEFVLGQGVLFLSALFIEPGKILFLNNAINHGLLGPLGIHDALEKGHSIFFLLETNPGPGLGILLAYWFYGRGPIKESTPTAAVFHFLGGIHEIYFPYVLMNPLLFIAVILGGMSGIATFEVLGAGLVATPSPGSLFALLALTPKANFLAVVIGITVSSLVTFFTAGFILSHKKDWDLQSEGDRSDSDLLDALHAYRGDYKLSKIIFACDAGMGSSAMGASILAKLLHQYHIDIPIENVSIDDLPKQAELVITYVDLLPRARKGAPKAYHVGLRDFLDKEHYEKLVQLILDKFIIMEVDTVTKKDKGILLMENIRLNCSPVSKDEAIKRAGEALYASGYVDENYIGGMLAREEKFSTFIGNGVAIPHGENSVKEAIRSSGIVVFQYPDGIDYGDGKVVRLVIGIAGKGNEHIQMLANIAEAIEDERVLKDMLTTNDPACIYALFAPEGEL